MEAEDEQGDSGKASVALADIKSEVKTLGLVHNPQQWQTWKKTVIRNDIPDEKLSADNLAKFKRAVEQAKRNQPAQAKVEPSVSDRGLYCEQKNVSIGSDLKFTKGFYHMAKTVYSYQEIGNVIDSCNPVVFTCHPVARVTVLQKPFPHDYIKVTINLSIGDTCVGIMENEYASMIDLLDAFQIVDLDEIWEVLEQHL